MDARARSRMVLLSILMVSLTGLGPAHATEPQHIKIPVTVGLGNAVVPVVGVRGGYAWHPPQLIVVSVPFAQGVLDPKAPLAAYDNLDRALPTEKTILATWPDGSVRWAQLRFESHVDARKWTVIDYGAQHDGVHTQLPWEYRVCLG